MVRCSCSSSAARSSSRWRSRPALGGRAERDALDLLGGEAGLGAKALVVIAFVGRVAVVSDAEDHQLALGAGRTPPGISAPANGSQRRNSRRCRASVVNTCGGAPPTAAPSARVISVLTRPSSRPDPGAIRGPGALRTSVVSMARDPSICEHSCSQFQVAGAAERPALRAMGDLEGRSRRCGRGSGSEGGRLAAVATLSAGRATSPAAPPRRRADGSSRDPYLPTDRKRHATTHGTHHKRHATPGPTQQDHAPRHHPHPGPAAAPRP